MSLILKYRMENEFKQVMSERTDDELIKIITVEKESYQPLAISAAETEIEKRNIDITNFEKIREKAIIEKEKYIKTDSRIVGSEVRFLHYFIDTIICYVLSFFVIVLAGLLTPIANDAYLTLISFILILGTFFGYYFIMESKYQKTLGKYLTKSKVVNKEGNIPTQNEIMTRTFCRFIPFDNFSFLFTKNGFHDSISSTKVIKDNFE